MKNITYIIEKDIVRIWFDGLIKSESVIKVINLILKERDKLPPVLRVMVDSRRAKYDSKPDELQQIFKKLKEESRKFEQVRLTVVQQSPYETAISILLQELLKDVDKIKFGVFSTEQAAIMWLK